MLYFAAGIHSKKDVRTYLFEDLRIDESAFIKAPTRTHLLQVNPGPSIVGAVPSNQLLKVKVEIDTDPPGAFETEVLPVLDPIPFNVRIVSLPGLFAGKMHCVLCRRWKSRVK
ncbi:MAG: hypothetical protein U5P10_09365 [Spirochaetia bacterium]|nr:hypothetical protein [Spirochaetia bacterium]